ncbi:hypothetical protein [Desulfosarcina sp. BuS5]|uniref:hypothetical protein n=1 Tax=Desulfosarcina sp. BuS5 TaxID=933262 RepID=UPI000489C5C2|nr:hypothetical protein [Desulfosarcina sp. BuS5]
MAKPLSLADRIAQSKKENENKEELNKEKRLIRSLDEPQNHKIFKQGSGQGQVNSTQYRPNIDTVSTLDQLNIRSESGLHPVSNIGSRSGLYPVSSNTITETVLAPQQQRVYEWFLTNGLTGYFNKGIISRDTGINTPTIRKCLTKLKKLSLIQTDKYDPVSRQQKYKLNTNIKVTLIPGSGIGPVSTQGLISGIGQVGVRSTSYKIDRKINNNLSIYLKNSKFWQNQGLTEKKLISWINEIDHCDSDYLYQQLQFAEAISHVKQADNPINYFYKSILKSGFTRPKGFKLPEERAAILRQEEIKRRENFLKLQEENRKKEQELADRESFLAFLGDKQTVESAIKEIEKQFISSNMKISIKTYRDKNNIDSRLERYLRRIFFSKS